MAAALVLAAGTTMAAGHSHGAHVSPPDAPPLLDGLGAHHHAVTTTSPLAQRYFDQGLGRRAIAGSPASPPPAAGGTFSLAGNSGTTQTISGGDTLTVNGSQNVTVTAGLSDTVRIRVTDPMRVDAFSGVDCTGGSDSRTGVQGAVNALNPVGQTLWVPSLCRLGFSAPTPPAPAIVIQNNVQIFCEDASAGFFANHQSCKGGTYAGAACNTNTECLSATGNGSCSDDFFHGAANPCTATTCFAPAATTTYTMFQDTATNSSDIAIQNCSIWTNQADSFQRCVSSGAHNGSPCRQECDNGAAGFGPGSRCEVPGDCPSSTCLRTADCHADAGPGLCNGAPKNGSGNATSKINVIDLTRTYNVKIFGMSIYDHFSGDFGVSVGNGATFRDDNFAREITDGTSPIPSTPSGSSCLTVNAGKCNYGALPFVGQGNTQPRVAVTNDVVTGTDAQLLRVTARGSSASFSGGQRTRIDECTVVPTGPLGGFDFAGGFGPGTPANGYAVADYGIVAKSYALNLAGGATGILLQGTAAGAVANKLRFNGLTGGGIGISSTGAAQHLDSNTIDNVSGAGKCVSMTGGTSIATDIQCINASGTTTGAVLMSASNQFKTSQIALTGSGQTGIYIARSCGPASSNPGVLCTSTANANNSTSCQGTLPTCTGSPPICGGTTTEAGALCCQGRHANCIAPANNQVEGNIIGGVAGAGVGIDARGPISQINNNTINMTSTATGVGIDVSNTNDNLGGNIIVQATGAGSTIGINLHSAGFASLTANDIYMPTTEQTPMSHQICIKYDASTQDKFIGNTCSGGWRGFTNETSGNGLLNNSQYVANRIVSQSGACFALGGAGAFVDGNYCNASGSFTCPLCTFARPMLVCDGGCTNRGIQCAQDSDCGTCTNSINKCIPEPQFAFVGAPGASVGTASTAHNTYSKNIVFGSHPGVKQCSGTTTFVGSACETAGNTCAGGATCSGGPPSTCQTGSEQGRSCCAGGVPICSARTPTPYFRVMDYGSASSHTLLVIALNTIFAGQSTADSIIGVDFLSSTTADLAIQDSQIVGNVFDGSTTLSTPTNSSAIRFPTSFTSITHFDISDNGFFNWPIPASTGIIQNYQGSMGSLFLRNGNMFTGQGTVLRATAGNDFFTFNGSGAAAATDGAAVPGYVAPFNMTVWKMTCTIANSTGAGNTRTFFLRDNGVSSAMMCVFSNPNLTCTPAAGATSAPFSITAGHVVNLLDTAVGTPTRTTGTCYMYASIDSYF